MYDFARLGKTIFWIVLFYILLIKISPQTVAPVFPSWVFPEVFIPENIGVSIDVIALIFFSQYLFSIAIFVKKLICGYQ